MPMIINEIKNNLLRDIDKMDMVIHKNRWVADYDNLNPSGQPISKIPAAIR
jgi:hypothetical protein